MAAMSIFPFYSLQDDDLIFSSFNSCDTDNADIADFHDINPCDTKFASKLMEATPEFKYYTDENDTVTTLQTSEYVTASQFNSISINFEENFSLLHFNTRSLNKHFEYLKYIVSTMKFPCSVMGLSETWLRDESVAGYSIDGYILETNSRAEKRGG